MSSPESLGSTATRMIAAILSVTSVVVALSHRDPAADLTALAASPSGSATTQAVSPQPPQTTGSGWLLRSGGWYIRVDGSDVELPPLPGEAPRAIDVAEETTQESGPLPANGRLPFDELIARHAQQHGFDWRLIAALIFEESRFQPESRSSQGAIGLMQVRPIAAEQVGMDKFEEPADNIRAGVKYLRYLDDLFATAHGDDRLGLVLAAYNMGPAHVRDAQALAEYYGFDPNRWQLSMDRIVPLLEDPEVHKFLASGFAKGSNVVSYVERICRRYAQYRRELGKLPGSSPDAVSNLHSVTDSVTDREHPSGAVRTADHHPSQKPAC